MKRFEFHVIDNGELEQVVRKTGRSNPADVVRDALALYTYLLSRRLQGDKIFLGKGVPERELVVITFEVAKMQEAANE